MKSVKQSFELKDKIAVITGGAGMLGEKHAEAIAEFGGVPILLDIDDQPIITPQLNVSPKKSCGQYVILFIKG